MQRMSAADELRGLQLMKRVSKLLLGLMLLSALLPASPAHAETLVSGVISSNTTWTLAGSPYVITDTVQIPEGVTLSIDPGVAVRSSDGVADMFLVHGTLSAIGTESQRVVFDGAGTSNFFSPMSSSGSMLVHVEFADISNGRSLWPPTGYQQYGRLILRDSLISDLTYYAYIWYPQQDVFIERNTFINAVGFSVGHMNANVYIRWNRFLSMSIGFSEYPAWVANWAAYGASRTIVTGNVFHEIPAGRYALFLPPGSGDASLDGSGNYWGTTDESYVQTHIYDASDDITSAGTVPYNPILASEPAEVPPHPKFGLTVNIVGTGAGAVTSSPSGIQCPGSCVAEFPMGSEVSLDAVPSEGSTFIGWSGCAGTPCAVTLDASRSVTAHFALEHVDHERTVSLLLKRHLVAKGLVSALSNPACAANVQVRLERKTQDGWKTLAAPFTSEDGAYRIKVRDRVGRYRSSLLQHDVDSGNSCLTATSTIARHRH